MPFHVVKNKIAHPECLRQCLTLQEIFSDEILSSTQLEKLSMWFFLAERCVLLFWFGDRRTWKALVNKGLPQILKSEL